MTVHTSSVGMTSKGSDKKTICPACGEDVPESGVCCGFSQQYASEAIPLMAELSIEAENRTLPITARWVRIGRDPANQIVLLDDLFVSRYHAWVTFEQDKFWLEDLGSTNGTLLNEQPVQKRILLTSGDKIKIGETDITFRLLNDNK